MKTNFFSNTAPVIPTPSTSLGAGSAKRSGGISRLTHDATIKAGAHVSRFLGKLGMTVLLLSPVVLPAQTNGVTVSGLSAGAGTVTFGVGWKQSDMPEGNNKVWVFVDHNDNSVMKRLLVSGATVSAGTVDPVNDKGAWVINSENVDNFSTTVTLSFTSPSIISGACVYASGYPPEAEYTTATAIKFTGTLPYDLVLEDTDGNTITRQSGNLFDVPSSYTLLSFTDKTGAPGVIKCIPPATFTLLASASGFCEDDMEGITFALDSTEKDKQYQLFRNNGAAGDGSVLTGNGSALTFTGTFNVAGTYTARTVADGLTCAIAMNGTHVVTKNPLPANPVVTGDSRNCPGTVTLSASSSGAVIDWYDDVTTSTLHTGESYTPEIKTSTTYYAQARVNSTGCLSAPVAVAAEVDMDGCFTAPGATVTFTAFDPNPSASTGTVWYLTDTREASLNNTQTYKVKKMADGHIWMVQDLKFGSKCNKDTFSGSNGSDKQGGVSALNALYYGDCMNKPGGSAARGYIYDWAAAMQKAGAYHGTKKDVGCSGTDGGTTFPNPGACPGLCPDGWHLPTGASGGEYSALQDASDNCDDENYHCWAPNSEFEGSFGGFVWQNGDKWTSDTRGLYHSSTNTFSDFTCCLLFVHGQSYPSMCGGYQWYAYGATVRCVMNYY